MRSLFVPSLIIIGLLVGCATSSVKKEISIAPFEKVELKENGLTVLFIKDESLPVVVYQALVKTGNLHEPKELPGLNLLTAGMLRKGTGKRTADQVADAFGDIGSELLVMPDRDLTKVSVQSLSPYSKDLFLNFLDVLKNPSFPESELVKLKAQYEANLKKSYDNPGTVVDLEADTFVFGSHPYARNVMGNIGSLKKMTRQNIVDHFKNFYGPKNVTMAISGNYSAEDKKMILAELAKWSGGEVKIIKPVMAESKSTSAMRFVAKAGLKQTQIRMGRLGLKRNNPDHLKMRLALEILGGSFGTRLMTEIREKQGLTYSISASLDSRLDPGMIEISTFTKNESVEKIISETLKVYDLYVSKGITDYELKAAKAQLIGQFPHAIETHDRLAGNLMALDYMGVDAERYLKTFRSQVEAITVRDVNEAISRNLGPLKVTVYGDPSIASQLRQWNPEQVIFSSP